MFPYLYLCTRHVSSNDFHVVSHLGCLPSCQSICFVAVANGQLTVKPHSNVVEAMSLSPVRQFLDFKVFSLNVQYMKA